MLLRLPLPGRARADTAPARGWDSYRGRVEQGRHFRGPGGKYLLFGVIFFPL